MSSASMWIEISISGFFYFITIIFIILKVAGIKDLGFISDAKDFVSITAVGIALASYLLGILAHRLLPAILGLPLKLIKRLFNRKNQQEELEDVHSQFVSRVALWQYGSERLHKEMDFQFSLRSMMLSLVFGLPISGVSAAIWLRSTSYQQLALPVIVTGFVLGFSFYLSYMRQKNIYQQIRRAAFEEMKSLKKIVQKNKAA